MTKEEELQDEQEGLADAREKAAEHSRNIADIAEDNAAEADRERRS